MTKKIIYILIVFLVFVFAIFGLFSYKQKILPSFISRQLKDRSCTKDKYCALVYTEATRDDPCEHCPADLSSDDYICANYKAVLNFKESIGDGTTPVLCEACGSIKYKNTDCKCNNNLCEKVIN